MTPLRLRWVLPRTGRKWHGTRSGLHAVFLDTLCGRAINAPRRREDTLPQEAIHRLEVCGVCWRNRG